MDEHISKYMKGQCQGGEEAEEIQTEKGQAEDQHAPR